MRVFLSLVALLAAVGCGDGSSLSAAQSDDVSPAVQALVDKSLQSDHWSEDDRVTCDGHNASPPERVLGESYTVTNSSLFRGREGDILIVRLCNEVQRHDGMPVFDMRGECADPVAIIVGPSGLRELGCYSFVVQPDEDGGLIEETEVDVYMKHIGNVDYLQR